jgi:hypothetical protein
VDIISISWVVRFWELHDEDKSPLALAIQRAVDRNILVFCSTADVGPQSGQNAWPVNLRNVIAVSASDRLGHPRLESDHDVHVMFEGDNVPAEGPKYLHKDKKLGSLTNSASGSSVSTALAAGLGSLCLFLARMANDSATDAELFHQRIAMLVVFRAMQGSESDKVIMTSHLFKGFGRVQYGSDDPPEGVRQFRYARFQQKIALAMSQNSCWAGHSTRRARSQTRGGMGI